MIKKFLFHSLGTKNFLKLLHLGFHFSYNTNGLKNDVVYKYHYFDKNIIQEGDYVIDIGANLGYYTKLFAKWVGNTGHVYAVGPVKDYFDTIQWGLKDYKNVTLYNNALGDEEKEVTLTAPSNQGYIRTGLTHISSAEEIKNDSGGVKFKAQMKQGSKLFANLKRIDFIKCDIEGYEEFVLPEIKDVLLKHKPIVQLETFGDQASNVELFLTGIGYKVYDIEDGKVTPKEELKKVHHGDVYFIHKDKCDQVIDRLKKMNLA